MSIINYGKQFLDNKDLSSVRKVLQSDYLTQGPKVDGFEKALLKKFGGKFCSVVSSGTAALHLLGLALGWKKNDIILTTPLTFAATSNCIVYTGAKPIFVDIDENTGTICPKNLEKKIKSIRNKGKKIKAIIGMDYGGHPCDWLKIKSLSKQYKITLINDNCHGMGAALYNNKKYAIKYADFITLSFHPVKALTTAEGGAVIGKNKIIDEKIKSLRSHGIIKNEKKGLWFYQIKNLGYNYRISDVHCALGLSQLQKLDNSVKKRQKIAKIYDKYFRKIENIIIPFKREKFSHAYHLYAIRINFTKFNLTKKEFFLKLLKKRIKLQVHYIPVYKHPFYKKNYKNKEKNFPKTEIFYNQVVSLPVYYSLQIKDQLKVIKNIKQILKF